ncbi:immunity protein YezG family protein [uncultured Ruminococcus sp.]
MSKKDTWTVMTLVVDENGNFKADYEYKDISEDLVGYYNEWKNRYLR